MRIFVVIVLSVLFFSCKNSRSDDKTTAAKDFLNIYKPLSLPVNVADSGLANFGDTTTIDYNLFTQFIPDSAVNKILNKQISNYVIHPAEIIHTKNVDYLLTKFQSGKTVKLLVFVLDDKHQYKSSLFLLSNINIDEYSYSVSVTNEPAFIIKREKTGADKEHLYSRDGYAFNTSSNAFAEVLNDSNEDEKKRKELINPIDTLAAINKFSGDYIQDKRNYISIRDGKNQHTYIFFIHFEKGKDNCTGELKGQMRLVNETNAVYQESGDPCVIHFKFTATSIKINEEGNCGNYRGITCPFDFNFKKNKQAKGKRS